MTKIRSSGSDDLFQSPFLADVSAALSMKKKVFRHLGTFRMQPGRDEDGEWLTVTFHRSRGPYIVVELLSQQAANIYVRSARKEYRGKVLARLEEIRIPANTNRIIETIIATCHQGGYGDESHQEIERLWRGIACTVI